VKHVLLAAVAAVCLLGSLNAQALPCQFSSCASTVTADSGVTAKRCYDNSSTICSDVDGQMQGAYCNYQWVFSTMGCPSTGNWWVYANHVDGKKLCVSNYMCSLSPQATEESIYSSDTDSGLDKTFAPQAPNLGDVYYGYVTVSSSTTNRSPSNGRTTSIKARLDVCIGATDVDSAVANGLTWCQQTGCGAAANEYCEAYGTNNGQTNVFAAVCKDRCECMINGTTDASCDQL
jgi:hypothetical protein